MIRLSTLFWVGLAGLVGFGLYHLKHEVQALEDELFRANRQILAEEEAIHVLHAEWSYLNQPNRLQALVARHLDLRPTKPAQMTTIGALPGASNDPLPAAVPARPEKPAHVPSVRVTSVSAAPGTR